MISRSIPVLCAAVLVAASGWAVEIVHVPHDEPTFQSAVAAVSDGGVIELAAGSYASPVGGFALHNLGKGFTVRPDGTGPVSLTGNNVNEILRSQNSVFGSTGPLVFEDLTFDNGSTSQAGLAAGVTIYEGEASFIRCLFRGNVSNASTVGGALYIANNSRAVIIESTFENNTSITGGAGLGIRNGVEAWVSGSIFRNNRCNVPNHQASSGGGGINIGNADLRVADTIFEDNAAGGFGGGLYAIGTWQLPYEDPRPDVVVTNCEFTDNFAQRDPSVTGSHAPTEGGAINAENQTLMRIFSSRFDNNQAMIGGGVNGYRARIQIYDSEFRGNRATDRSSTGSGFGGAVKVTSDDGTGDGNNNRPPSDLVIERCLFQGQAYGTGANATVGGCLFAGGDGNRIDGNPTVPDMGTIEENRATVVVRDSIFSECDSVGVSNQKGDGGAAYVVLTDLLMEDSLVIDCDARGSSSDSGWAGGVMGLLHSDLEINGTTFSRNTAGKFGGAIVVQGSNIEMSDTAFYANVLEQQTFGGAMFAGVDLGRDISVTGSVTNCVFADHAGITIYDDDRNDPALPINEIRYINNQFWVQAANGIVYQNPLGGQQTPSGLNALVIDRGVGLPDTDKGSGNAALSDAPEIARLLAAPPDASEPLAGEGIATAPLAWAATGATAFLDGTAVNPTGLTDVTAGEHNLVVGGASDAEVIGTRPVPQLTFYASPSTVQIGGSATLNWQVVGSTFEDGVIDQGVGPVASSVGSVQVSPDCTTVYHFAGVTRDGAVSGEVTVTVGDFAIFTDGFENGSVGAWSSSTP